MRFRRGSTTIPIPVNPSLVGMHVYSQSAPLDPGANQLGLAFSNGIDTLVGG